MKSQVMSSHASYNKIVTIFFLMSLIILAVGVAVIGLVIMIIFAIWGVV